MRSTAKPALTDTDDNHEIRLSEVIAALSYALDLTEGQPMGHSVRSCLIGMRLASVIGLPAESRSALFYALLLKDAGCSSNAARIASLFGADDRAIKFDRKLTHWPRTSESLRHVVRTAGRDASALTRVRRVMAVSRSGAEGAKQLTELRCERGADIALSLGLPTPTAEAIRGLDEHWDGGGYYQSLEGDQIPLLARILGLAQTVEVFCASSGTASAFEMARDRRGTWFDPELVDALETTRSDEAFWVSLPAKRSASHVAALEPEDRVVMADHDALDRVAWAFATVVDAKSPWTFRHSKNVADIAVGIGEVLSLSSERLRDLNRAALLHDIGKLGVSNTILDKPDALTASEWELMRRHPEHTKVILDRVAGFRGIAGVAASHHERLDGSGYHRGLTGRELSLDARILAVADVAEALSAARPYRAALEREQVIEIMSAQAGTGLDRTAFSALQVHLLGEPARSGPALTAHSS